jgi:predicted membrane protein (TIGR00267 family)
MPKVHVHQRTNGLLGSIRELVFGLEDSLVSTLGVVVGVAAGTRDPKLVILTGAVLVIVEALSMAAGSFLSTKSHRQLLEEAIREEREEIEQDPEGEKEELKVMYRSRGFTEDEVDIIVRRITADKDLWLEEMVAKELRIGALERETPKWSALVMFLSYLVGGVIPIAPYLGMPIGAASAAAVALTVAALFAVGFVKAKITSTEPLRSGIEMVLVSSAAAVLGYAVGKGIGAVFGISLPE